jgi:hypothetical protein
MIRLQVDRLPLGILAHVTEPAELLDAQGEVLGHFTPNPKRVRERYGDTAGVPGPEELERQRTTAGPEYTTREVFEHLLALTSDPQMQTYLRGKIEKLATRD